MVHVVLWIILWWTSSLLCGAIATGSLMLPLLLVTSPPLSSLESQPRRAERENFLFATTLVLPSRTQIKQVQLPAERFWWLQTDPWSPRCPRLAMSVVGTCLFYHIKNNKFHSAQMYLTTMQQCRDTVTNCQPDQLLVLLRMSLLFRTANLNRYFVACTYLPVRCLNSTK